MRSQAGFTLIEVMVGILIMAATSVSLFYGVNYARAQSRKNIMQQRALEELTSEMDYWMVRIMDGQFEARDLQADKKGVSVVLYQPETDEPFAENEEYFEAKIFREKIDRDISIHDPLEFSPYYELEMYIQWDDHLGDIKGEPMEIRMQTSVFRQ